MVKSMAKYLSTTLFLVLYIAAAVLLIYVEGFVPETQAGLATTMLPFTIIAFILDYSIGKTGIYSSTSKILIQILPLGVFILIILSMLLETTGRSEPGLFKYLIFLFVTAPFAFTAYQKELHKKQLICSVIGTALFFSVYLFITTKTDLLNESSGLMIYMISTLFILYASSTFPKFPYLGSIFGLGSGIILYLIYRTSSSDDTIVYGWDFYIEGHFEYILIGLILLGVLVTFIRALTRKKL